MTTVEAPVTVLYVDPVAEPWGSELVIEAVALHLDRAEFRAAFVFLAPGAFAERLRARGFEVTTFRPHRFRQVARVVWTTARIAVIARRSGARIIHANGGAMPLYTALAARAAGAALVWQLHDPMPEGGLGRLLTVLQRPIRPVAVIATTREVRDAHARAFVAPPLRRVIAPVIEVTMVTPDEASRERETLGVPADGVLIAMFARFQQHKGHADLVRAAAALVQRHPSARFVLCGDTQSGLEAQYAEEVQRLVEEHSLTGTVLLPGFVTEDRKRRIMAASDVVAHPARHESFGLAVYEALMMGRPVVAADAAGPRSLIEHGVSGLLVPPGDPAALAEAIGSMLTDVARAAALAKEGQSRAAALATPHRMSGEVAALYREVLRSSPSTKARSRPATADRR